MDSLERQLLENLFDSLDRLFDRECQASDVYHLCFASNIALKSLESTVELDEYIHLLQNVLKKNESIESQRDSALDATNQLRYLLNDILSED